MIFGTFCVAMTIHVFLMYPETARMTLEEIDVMFDSNVPVWRSPKYGDTFAEKVAQMEREGGATAHETRSGQAAQEEV